MKKEYVDFMTKKHGMKRGLRFLLSNQVSSSNLGVQGFSFQPLNITYDPLKQFLMVRWMRLTFEFDQPNKQTESKMQVNRDQAISRLNLCDCGNAQTSNPK